ncbi:MAG: helix-turn-helix domain-containing protein [Haloarculaceae archaeon]
MKYATLSLRQRPALRHPMHQFLVERDGFDASRLVGSTITGGHHAALFHVDGWPPDPYEAALADVETVRDYALSRQSDRTFSVYVREDIGDRDRELVEGLGQADLVVYLPVVYRGDGAMRVTLVGPAETLQDALRAIPDGVDVDVRDVAAYDARRVGGRRELTDRQADAVRAAVERGYYEEPRDASVADVAADLGVAPSTAAEHLRRAERTVMRSYLRPGRR